MTHHCHAKLCTVRTSPRMFMCRVHWFSLPDRMQGMVWKVYKAGQEVRKDPSEHYLQVTSLIVDWLYNKEYGSEESRAEAQNKYNLWVRRNGYGEFALA